MWIDERHKRFFPDRVSQGIAFKLYTWQPVLSTPPGTQR